MKNPLIDPNPFDPEDSDEDFGFQHLAWIAGLTLAIWLLIIAILFSL